MVRLIALLEPAQNRDRVLHGRLAHEHGLKAALKRRIFFYMFAILVERRGTHHAEFATREHRLEHIAGVHRAFGFARADDGVQLVNEHHELPLARDDFLEHALQPLLKLATELGASNQRAEVEREELFVLESFGDVAIHDALRESLGDGRLAHARFADEHRIVLGATRQHLNHATDFFVAANHGVELALACILGEVARELL